MISTTGRSVEAVGAAGAGRRPACRSCLPCRRRQAGAGRPARPRPTGRRAMTLLELILVLVIISTVLALASPSLRGFFGGRQADDLARQLVALTQWARSLAVAQGRPYRLNLDPRDGAFWLTVQEGGSFQELSVECGRRFLVPEGVQAAWEEPSDAASHGYVTFYPDGRSDVAVILLTGRQGQKLEVRCRSATEGWEAVQAEETGG